MHFSVSVTSILLRSPYRLLVLLFLLQLAACSHPDNQYQLDVLRVGVLPDQQADLLADRYSGLLEHLARELDVDYELIIPKTYDGLVGKFLQKKIDLAYFGGVTYIRAHEEAAAVPLVMRDVDQKFTSYFLVRAQDPARTIKDLRARRFCFGDSFSTSGHLMPRYFLNLENIIPEEYFSMVCYSGSHDKTARWIQDGVMDVGVANSVVVRDMFRTGRLSRDKVRVLWETPYFANYVWAVQPHLDARTTSRLRDAFLALSNNNAQHAKILSTLGAKTYLPASHGDFAALEKIMGRRDLTLFTTDRVDRN